MKADRCPKCKKATLINQADRKVCPICGHSVWAALNNKGAR